MSVPQPQYNNDDGPEQLPLPINAELIGKILGQDPATLTSDQVRKIKRLLKGFHGCVVIVANHGVVPHNGIYRIENFNIGPTEK